MSLNNALQIGRSGLLASQAAIQVTGNNMANVAVAGYHRQTVSLQPVRDQQINQNAFIGRGVQIQAIVRQVNLGLESRLRDGMSNEAGSLAQHNILTQIQAIQNEYSDSDLSSQLTAFFNAWSELANNPGDASQRSMVIAQGHALAMHLNTMQKEMTQLRDSVDTAIHQDTLAANDLLSQIAAINQQIVLAEGGSGQAHALRDQRDTLLTELSQYIDISINEQPNGAIDVFVGSLPVVLGHKSRGIEVRSSTVDGRLKLDLVISADGSVLTPQAGKLGAQIRSREEDVVAGINALDDFASHLIYEVNKIHSQGQGLTGFDSVTGSYRLADVTAALNDPASGMAFTPTHGSFKIYVTQTSTGQRVESQINVDLDGIGADTSLTDLVNSLNGVANITATITSDNRLKLSVNSGDFEISFGEDSSGVLAALGINTFFTGSTAASIGVNPELNSNPNLLASSGNGSPADNSNALAMARLGQQSPSGARPSISQKWETQVQNLAIKIGQTKQQLDAATIVRENLQVQQQSYSGVNIDEETINLMAFQRAYQGSARFLGVVDEMMQTLLQLI
jgi:flagellar hook-associated protein 1 FlgK